MLKVGFGQFREVEVERVWKNLPRTRNANTKFIYNDDHVPCVYWHSTYWARCWLPNLVSAHVHLNLSPTRLQVIDDVGRSKRFGSPIILTCSMAAEIAMGFDRA